MNKIKELIKENPITAVIFAITLITILFVPIDKEYISYFDFKTLGALYIILEKIEFLKQHLAKCVDEISLGLSVDGIEIPKDSQTASNIF